MIYLYLNLSESQDISFYLIYLNIPFILDIETNSIFYF